MTDRNKRKGFTLAELLVVVAIIAVLVAIAIPIFTSQLEKSREATDAANIRSQYAQVMTDAITNGGDVNGQTEYGAIELKQKKDNWQDMTLGNNLHGLFQGNIVGNYPKAGGKAWVEYKASESKVILHYEGEGSDNGSSSGGSTGESGSGGTGGGSTSSSSLDNFIINNSVDYGDGGYTGELGRIYNKNGQYYVCVYPNQIPPSSADLSQYTYTLLPISTTSTILKESSTQPGIVQNCKAGDLYYDGNDFYMIIVETTHQGLPGSDNTKTDSHLSGNWVKIKLK